MGSGEPRHVDPRSNATVIDQNGKVIYFGLERFVRDLCLGDCCFVCGARPGNVPFNDEHVIPRWILRRYNLFDRMINLPNGTSLRYDRYTVPCCEACNTLIGRMIEEPIRQIVEGGFDSVRHTRTLDRRAAGWTCWFMYSWHALPAPSS